MKFKITLDSAVRERDFLISLYDWLVSPGVYSDQVRLTQAVPEKGAMGSVTEAIVAVAGTGGSLTLLASAVRAWILQPRNAHIKLVIEEAGATGHRVELDVDRAKTKDVEALLEALVKKQRN